MAMVINTRIIAPKNGIRQAYNRIIHHLHRCTVSNAAYTVPYRLARFHCVDDLCKRRVLPCSQLFSLRHIRFDSLQSAHMPAHSAKNIKTVHVSGFSEISAYFLSWPEHCTFCKHWLAWEEELSGCVTKTDVCSQYL